MPHSEARNPRFITALAYLLWSFPLTYILVIGSFYNLDAHLTMKIFFSFYYIAHSVLAVATGIMLNRMRPYAWHFFLFHSFLLVVEQVVLAVGYAENHIPQIPMALAHSGPGGGRGDIAGTGGQVGCCGYALGMASL